MNITHNQNAHPLGGALQELFAARKTFTDQIANTSITCVNRNKVIDECETQIKRIDEWADSLMRAFYAFEDLSQIPSLRQRSTT